MHEIAFDVHTHAERRMNAPAEVLYELLADYTTHHPAILPPAITNLVVEQGGIGAGTLISFDVRLGGRSRRMRTRISEPRPGVLQETDIDSGSVTTFEVTEESGNSLVRISSAFASAPGLQGWIERHVAPRMLRKLYIEELANLEAYARQRSGVATAPAEKASA